jgi:hypothetical protein
MEISARIVGVPVDIRTEYLQNTSLQRYRLSQHARHKPREYSLRFIHPQTLLYREVRTFVDRFTATGAPPSARRIGILLMNQYAC